MTKTSRRVARQPAENTSPSTTPEGGQDHSNEKPKVPSKIAAVLALLKRDQGVTLDEIAVATGWQKHTIRASLTGLRKKGHALDKTKRDGVTCYHLKADR